MVFEGAVRFAATSSVSRARSDPTPSHWNIRSTLVKVSESPVRYERRLPNGTVEVYALSDGAPSGQRQIFLTELVDPQGQGLQFTWDAYPRLLAITDAVGQVTTFEYADSTDALKVTAVEDPFGRRATFTYNPAGQLASITDVLGLTSSFTYGENDFATSLTTPYGTTSFRHEPNPLNTLNFRFIEAAFSNYTVHRPQTYTDASGQTTTFTYNASGQILTVTDPHQDTTTSTYDPAGYLSSVSGPVSGATASFAYDGYGRARTVTDPDGYQVTIDYDVFDRPTRLTYRHLHLRVRRTDRTTGLPDLSERPDVQLCLLRSTTRRAAARRCRGSPTPTTPSATS